jgi:uncharacterized RDD family membrane protein YckC
MKCPKCKYLGFETGERCKNCGYDFSLLVTPPIDAPAELHLRDSAGGADGDVVWERVESGTADRGGGLGDMTFDGPPFEGPASVAGDDDMRLGLAGDSAPAVELEVETRPPDLPLFLSDDEDDVPLVRLPAAPRAPIAVRKTPDLPKLRPVVRAQGAPAPAFEFTHDTAPVAAPPAASAPSATSKPAPVARPAATWSAAAGGASGGITARAVAAAIDHAILLGIDLIVIYFTLRMTELGVTQLRVLPLAPLFAFLLFVKLAYFSAFTSIGGQTIGKMAARIKVVAEGDGPLGVSRALRRSAAGLLSIVPLGAGLLPAVFGPDRRAFHDRIAGTRVVAWPSA